MRQHLRVVLPGGNARLLALGQLPKLYLAGGWEPTSRGRQRRIVDVDADYPDRPTYSQRHGRGPRSARLSFEDFRGYVTSVIQDLFAQDYLQQAFGYHCIDNGDVPGVLGHNPDLYFVRRLGFPLMPIARSMPTLEPDQVYDLVEVLNDLVSKGMEDFGRFHSFNNCGWHYEQFNKGAGQAHLRDVLNPLLVRLEPSLILRSNGQLEELAPPHLQPLLDAPLPESAPQDDVRLRVEAAVTRFKRPRSNIDERRTAVRELADVLEFLRPQIKASMMSADEGALFNLANNFAIRHHNRDQRGDYEKPVWLTWAFYVYLATIQAVSRLIEHQED